jgi:hypothetical protein
MEPYEHAAQQIRAELPYSYPLIHLRVLEQRAILEGEVEWPYQKERAETAVSQAGGVMEVRNLLRVQPNVDPREVWRRIEEGFRRAAA